MRVACSPIMLEQYAWCIRLYCLALGAREIWAFGVEFGLAGPTPAVVSSLLTISYPCPHTIITCTFICGQITYHVHLPTYLPGTSSCTFLSWGLPRGTVFRLTTVTVAWHMRNPSGCLETIPYIAVEPQTHRGIYSHVA
jgi:hypothetical protein